MAYLVDEAQDTRAAHEIAEWLGSQTVRGLQPVGVEVRRSDDQSGTQAWFFVIVLDDPAPDEGTWPVEALTELDRLARDRAVEKGLSWPWYVVFRAATEDEQEDEEDQLQIPES